MSLPLPALATLRALLDRLIPRDEFPGATDAGVDDYVLRQLDGDLASERTAIVAGLAALEAEAAHAHGRGFTALPARTQDEVLEAIARGDVRTPWAHPPAAFFHHLVELSAEGFYADPGQGGNRDAVSWRMIGYDRRAP